MMKRVFFYATGSDMKPVLTRTERYAPLKFIPTGKRPEPNRPIYLQSSDIPDIGFLPYTRGGSSRIYMVSLRETKNRMYRYKSDKGEWRWLLSNGDNPDTVLLTLSGLMKTGTLLPGEVSTMHDTPVAQQLMRWFFSAVQEEKFRQIGVWWLGREALEMITKGHRLTQSEQSPPEFDLKLTDGLK